MTRQAHPEGFCGTLGLIAGGGRFPLLILEEARRRQIPVVTIAIREEADPDIQAAADTLHWVALGELGRCVEFFNEASVSRVIMAGQVKHKRIFRVIRPDRLLLKALSRLRSRNTDAILKTVADVFAEEGIELMDSTSLLSALLAELGPMAERHPTREEMENIAFGYRVAKEVARLDIGQTVVVKGKAVVAVEAMEGTDETIRRAAGVVSSAPGGLAVIKVARPSQDMRFDVPVVGPRTIDVMAEASASVLAIEAGKCLLVERDELLRRADRARIAVVGMSDEDARESSDS